jgi:hypothetical protein
MMNPDGSAAINLTNHPAQETRHDWQPLVNRAAPK